jgi:hypothetical protein
MSHSCAAENEWKSVPYDPYCFTKWVIAKAKNVEACKVVSTTRPVTKLCRWRAQSCVWANNTIAAQGIKCRELNDSKDLTIHFAKECWTDYQKEPPGTRG